ncbi:MAG TPA: ABC transporter ATP-binding protein [Thermoanaerobaculia bacterium]|nr:ABC transporter ATP-binding protein [Thermoanaerobaculia bacterium]
MSAVIRARELSKSYRRFSPGHRLRTLKSLFVRHDAPPRRDGEMVQALREVSFDVERGEMFSVIGGNGSGKSTLLKLISGILRPSSGTLVVDGRVTALIELGAGFHPEISGRENVFIAASVLGLGRREIEERYERIVEFSGLGEFLEEPVKNYSSGMYVRLGFAVAIHTDPEVLLVDEVLAVGDEAFAHRCIGKIEELLAAGRTVVFVSHALGMVEDLSTRVMWLDRGRARLVGEPRRVVDAYRQSVAESEGAAHRAEKEARERRDAEAAPAAPEPAGETLRWGSRAAEVVATRLRDRSGAERYHFAAGDEVVFEIDAVAHAPQDDFVFGVAVSTPRGVEVWGTNTELGGFRPRRFAGAARVRLVCPELRLAPGDYLVDVAVHARDGAPYDYRRKLLGFSVTSEERGVGVYFPRHRWEFGPGVELEPREER